jgi:hypothetical protein
MSDRDEGHLAEIVARLDADERYDVDPSGDPPISTAQYRKIARGVVFLEVEKPSGAPIFGTPEEAYIEGQRQIIGEIRRIVAVALNVLPAES